MSNVINYTTICGRRFEYFKDSKVVNVYDLRDHLVAGRMHIQDFKGLVKEIKETCAPKTKRPVTPPPPPPPRVEAPPLEKIIEKPVQSDVASALSEAAEKMGWLPKNDERKDLLLLAEHVNVQTKALTVMIQDLEKGLETLEKGKEDCGILISGFIKRIERLENPEFDVYNVVTANKAIISRLHSRVYVLEQGQEPKKNMFDKAADDINRIQKNQIDSLKGEVVDLREINRELSGVKSSFEANKEIMRKVIEIWAELTAIDTAEIPHSQKHKFDFAHAAAKYLKDNYGTLSE